MLGSFMHRRQFLVSFVLAALFLGPLSLPSGAQLMDPTQLVRDLYATHDKIPADATPIWTNNELRQKYFSSDLMKAIDDSYARTAADDLPPIDFDPLYNAQDWDEIEINVHDAAIDGEKAIVWVTVTNFGEAQDIAYHLQLLDTGWRIVDISYNPGADGFTLSSILTGN
jgi:Protein of unknown function (DUF3828)